MAFPLSDDEYQVRLLDDDKLYGSVETIQIRGPSSLQPRRIHVLIISLLVLIVGVSLSVGVIFLLSHRIHLILDLPQVTLIVVNGTIYSAHHGKYYEGMAINEHGSIIYLGTSTGARRYAGLSVPIYDAEGKLILPGFIDAHVHPVDGGLDLMGCFLFGLESASEVRERIQQCAKNTSIGNNGWIEGAGWDFSVFSNPQSKFIDDIVDDRPVFLLAMDGHSAWVNSFALRLANITSATPDPNGGRIERDANGNPTGCLREHAVDLVLDLIPKPSLERASAALKHSLALANSYGITSLVEARAEAHHLETYQALQAQNNLTVRVSIALAWDESLGVEQISDMVNIRERINGLRGGMLDVRMVKLFLDGVLEDFTAGLLDPYLTKGKSTGIFHYNSSDLNEIVHALHSQGFQVHMHGIGDGAVRMGLDAIEHSNSQTDSVDDLRPHIAHLQLIHPDDMKRFEELGVVANFQPYWFVLDEYTASEIVPALGPERSGRMYPMNSVLKTGAHLACGSDWDVSSLNPLDAIEHAVTRRHDKDEPSWLPQESISVQEAVHCYTSYGAYAIHKEHSVGRIAEGMQGDFIVLDRNIFSIDPLEIHNARVLKTFIGGKEVFSVDVSPAEPIAPTKA